MDYTNLIVKYSGARGPCLYDPQKCDWVRDDEGNPLPTDTRTGKPLTEVELCPSCKRPMRRKR